MAEPNVEEMIEQRRILAEAKSGMQREIAEQKKGRFKQMISKVVRRLSTPISQPRKGFQPISRKGQQVISKFGASLFPMLPKTARPAVISREAMARTGRRGRPKVYPSGVYAYRRAMAKQRAYQRLLARQQAMRMPQRQIQMAQTEEYYAPEEQAQLQMAQMPAQMPPVAQKRPIATVFKSSGGKPYESVDTRPLADTGAEYYEITDSFTGRRILKRRPQAEAWISGR